MGGRVTIAMLAAAASLASAQPAMPPDPRIRAFAYDPSQIYPIEVATGYTLMIALAPGERVETLAVGDSAAWQVTATKRGDAIFIKRLVPGVDTNLTVISDSRTYLFELIGTPSPGRALPLAIHFTYAAALPSQAPAPMAPEAIAYRLSGARALRPVVIRVAGNGLSLAWPEGVAVPAVFQIMDDGTEALVNGAFENDRMIVQGIPQRLIFRSGALMATATRVSPKHPKP